MRVIESAMRYLAPVLLVHLYAAAWAEPLQGKLIQKDEAIAVAEARVKTILVCVGNIEKQQTIFFASGKELRKEFPFRTRDEDEDLVRPDRPYWSVLFRFRIKDGRALDISTNVDALSAQAVEPPTEYIPGICW